MIINSGKATTWSNVRSASVSVVEHAGGAQHAETGNTPREEVIPWEEGKLKSVEGPSTLAV
jgi:hypothetical protein